MLDKNKVIALFHNALDAQNRLLAAKQALDDYLAERPPEPVRPTIVENWEEWTLYESAVEGRQKHEQALEHEVKRHEESYTEAARNLRNALPTGVWFREGDWLFGVAYDDWGGGKRWLRICDYTPDPPALFPTASRD